MKHEKIISFGKIDFDGIGKKINEVTLELSLKTSTRETALTTNLEKIDKYFVFSVCGDVWNNIKSDIIAGGQCLEELKPFFKSNETFNKIYKLWKEFHLNDSKSGTKLQQDYLNKNFPNYKGYTEAVEILKKANLLVDRDYEFGSKWLVSVLSEEKLKEICEIMELDFNVVIKELEN